MGAGVTEEERVLQIIVAKRDVHVTQNTQKSIDYRFQFKPRCPYQQWNLICFSPHQMLGSE